MSSSGETWVLNKIAELADRCGVSPAVADISLKLHVPEGDDDYYYTLCASDGDAETHEEQEKVLKVNSLLGMEAGFRRVENLREIEQIVDQALSLAPRARVR